MNVLVSDDHDALADALIAEADAADGLAPVDTEAFWAQWQQDREDPFQAACVPIGNLWSPECVFDELGLPEDWYRYHHDQAWLRQLKLRYNDLAERIVGRRLLCEGAPDPTPRFPAVASIADVFEARNVFYHDSFWLQQSAHDEDELAALLDRVEQRLQDPRAAFLPAEWDEATAGLLAQGVGVPQYCCQRGPVTFATSVFGTEELVYLMYDEPELAARFRDLILRTMLARRQVLEDEVRAAGQTVQRSFSFYDDNCYLLTPELYEFFGAPILQAMFAHCAPEPDDWRFQHSDSAMEHLLPILARFDLREVNFGPTVPTALIREHMPRTIIQGQLAPFTYSRHDRRGMVAEFLRDKQAVGATRGLRYATAGSVNNGSRLHDLRLIMAAVQRWGWY
ncbi:MAG: uroporphyrinogen decarboxylase family protein [Planctomycetota bacterium]